MKNEWPQIPLGDLTRGRPICYGVLKPGKRQSSGVPLIRITDITENELDDSDIYLITPELSAEFRRSQLEGGEILLSIQGTIGRTAICPERLRGANISRTIAVVAPDKRIDRSFLRYWLLSLDGNFPVCGSTRASLNIGALRALRAPAPPLSEQRRIAGLLGEAFAALATVKVNTEKNLQNARAVFESHLHTVFTRRGSSWVEARLDALTEHDSPITYGVVKPGPAGEIRFVRGGDLVGGKVRLDQLRTITRAVSDQYRRTLLRGGELLICLVGQPGQVAVAPDELAGANIARQVGLIRLKKNMNAEFVRYFLQSDPGAEALGARESGSVQQVINLGDLRHLSVPHPKIAEQNEIVADLEIAESEAQRLAALYRQKLSALETLRKSLLYHAFAGQL